MKSPVLSEEASQLISEEYSRLRSQDTINSDIARVFHDSLFKFLIIAIRISQYDFFFF